MRDLGASRTVTSPREAREKSSSSKSASFCYPADWRPAQNAERFKKFAGSLQAWAGVTLECPQWRRSAI
jgi:hypothetical protein